MKKLFVILSFILAFTMLFTACAPAEAPEEDTMVDEPAAEDVADDDEVVDAPVEAPSTYTEAPLLTAMVEAGELPPVDERLPDVPYVAGPGTEIVVENLDFEMGKYGGTLRSVHKGTFQPDLFMASIEGLITAPGLGIEGVHGNVVEDFSVNEDATVYTFKMREGLKWSDGEPVTRVDVEFAWNDVWMNEDLNPAGPKADFRAGGVSNGTPMTLEFVDDWTFTLTFDQPYGSFVGVLAIKGWASYQDLIKPSHFLKQYHKDYADAEELATVMDEMGFIEEDWANFFNSVDVINWDMYNEQAIGFPQLSAWVLTEMTEGAIILERNPYYFKVDPDGQQLPYIDGCISTRVDNTDMVNTRGIAGDADFLRQDPSLAMVPLYKENEVAGNYDVVLLQHHTGISYKMNFTNEDPAWNEVVNDLRFRQALNLGTDQDEILQFVYNTFGQESLVTPWEYDLDAANALLDDMGMTEYDEDGYRKSPSGLELEILVEAADGNPDMIPIAELLIEYLEDLKIKSQLEILSGELLTEHFNANETMIVPERINANLWASGAWTDWTPDMRWGIEWMRWYNTTDEFDGVEPPDEIKRLFELSEMRGAAVSGSPEDTALYNEVIQSYQDNLWQILPVQRWDTLIVSKDLRNMAGGSEKSIGANTGGEIWWFDN